jgi:hypothetical protein
VRDLLFRGRELTELLREFGKLTTHLLLFSGLEVGDGLSFGGLFMRVGREIHTSLPLAKKNENATENLTETPFFWKALFFREPFPLSREWKIVYKWTAVFPQQNR